MRVKILKNRSIKVIYTYKQIKATKVEQLYSEDKKINRIYARLCIVKMV